MPRPYKGNKHVICRGGIYPARVFLGHSSFFTSSARLPVEGADAESG